jgi:hypothetical protein
MAYDLFGREYTSNYEIARKIVTKGYSKPFIRISRHPAYPTTHENILTYYDEDGEKVSLHRPGLYSIYRKIGDGYECLYVGQSNSNIGYRIYRFMKELEGRSRKDESHPGAKKARKRGVKPTDNLYLKIVDMNEIDPQYHHLPLDEYVVPLLSPKFNKKRKA